MICSNRYIGIRTNYLSLSRFSNLLKTYLIKLIHGPKIVDTAISLTTFL